MLLCWPWSIEHFKKYLKFDINKSGTKTLARKKPQILVKWKETNILHKNNT